MATFAEDHIERHRSGDLKHTKSPKTKGTSLRHKTRTPTDAFRQSEQSLRELLDDFESGRLNAFGNSNMLQKMSEIRVMQEKLTLKHFEIDQMKVVDPDTGSAGEAASDSSLLELTQGLEKLGSAIQSLHSDGSLLRGHGTKPSKSVSLHPVSSSLGEES